MRTLPILCTWLVCLTAGAQQNFANTNTGAITATTPYQLTLPGGSVQFVPSSNQCVAAGWLTVSNAQMITPGYIATAWSIVPLGNGWCNIIITSSNNIQAMFNAAITNSPIWNVQTIADLQLFTNRLDRYVGSGGETSAVVNDFNTWQYCMTNPAFLNSFTNWQNMSFCLKVADTEILVLPGITNTAQFWAWAHFYGVL